mmetsp:Transcript_34414/g.60328  ORF Transcript_34414/g.60328 Transcript_34414/m.60328 type:complete len:178 (-) Transcript_34414:341-874(-)
MADQIPEISVHLLVNELLKFVVTKDTACKDFYGAVKDLSPSQLNAKKKELKEVGISVGARVAETVARDHIWHKEVNSKLRFVCKEFWTFMFGKTMDRLQTNNKGIYVLFDSTIKWARHATSSDLEVMGKTSSMTLGIVSGAIKGCLQALGLDTKTSEAIEGTFYKFTIRINEGRGSA